MKVVNGRDIDFLSIARSFLQLKEITFGFIWPRANVHQDIEYAHLPILKRASLDF